MAKLVKEINKRVYELYGLTEEERKIIEKFKNMAKKDFQNCKHKWRRFKEADLAVTMDYATQIESMYICDLCDSRITASEYLQMEVIRRQNWLIYATWALVIATIIFAIAN